jgi:zinc and cadmium transporter
MHVLAYILLSVVVVSLISLIGIFTIALDPKRLHRLLLMMVSFAAGAMLGAAFLDLLPEALENGVDGVFWYVLLGIVIFFVIEEFLCWYHCHNMECERHTHIKAGKTIGHHHHKMPVVYLNLIGDGAHNFMDGAIIATSYLVSIPLGLITTLAVIAHEIPQEIGDFGVLIYGGFTRAEALTYNLISALVAVAGALFAFFFASGLSNITQTFIPIAAGGFIYMSTVDLLPELHKTKKLSSASLQMLFFFLGIGVIWAVTKFVE